jgi:hypothetical protein
MKKTAVLRFFQGTIQEGCPTVELQIYRDKQQIDHRLGRLPTGQEISITFGKTLEEKFNNWLNSKDFEEIKEFFIFYAKEVDILIIESSQLEIKRLPWLQWSTIKKFCPNIFLCFTSSF